ncbi:MAG: VOC family protein [Acidimicrobiaceae bacterium]|nr:VOC family protein [Acidimicrobiaceae bacterium]
MRCYCCGEEREQVVSLLCHDEVKVCRECIGWLRASAGIVDTTPILPVLDMDVAGAFYEKAGFDVRRHEGGGYAFVHVDDESVFDLDVSEPPLERAANRSGCYLVTPRADEWHRRLSTDGLSVTAIEAKPWGMTEFTLTDPDGNQIRIGRSTGS